MVKTSSFILSLLLCYAFSALASTPIQTKQTLIDIYQQALIKDPTLASSQSALLASQELIEQAKALNLPTVTATANVSHTESNIRYIGTGNVFRNGGNESFDNYGYGVNINQPIFRKLNWVQGDIAKKQVSQADTQVEMTKQDLMIRVVQSYVDLLNEEAKINLLSTQKQAVIKQLEQAKANFEVGTSTITDMNEAQARFDLILAQEIVTQNDLQISRRAIQAIIGDLPLDLKTVTLDLKLFKDKASPAISSLEDWVRQAEQNNPSLKLQQQRLDLATLEIDRQNAGHYPTLDALASATDNTGNGSPNGFGSELKSAQIGLQLQIPLYQGGAISSRVRQAVLNKQKAQDDLEATRRQVALATQQAYLNWMSNIAQVHAYEQAVNSSQSQVDATTLGYEVGVRTSVDLLNAQQQLFTTKRDLLQSRYNQLLNFMKLKQASGLINETDIVETSQFFITN